MAKIELVRYGAHGVASATGLHIPLPVFATVGQRDGEVLGGGGLTWGNNRCWLWFHMEQPMAEARFLVVREARRMLRKAVQLGEREVYTIRDGDYPGSAKLLKIVGFQPFGMEDGHEVHIWRHSH